MSAISTVFCGLVAAVGFFAVDAQNCCFQNPFMVDCESGVTYKDNRILTDIGVVAWKQNAFAKNRTFTDVMTGAKTRELIIQEIIGQGPSAKKWTIVDDTECSLQVIPKGVSACIADSFTKKEPLTYGTNFTVDRYQRTTPTADFTLYFTPQCQMTNSRKVKTRDDGTKEVYERIYGSYREVQNPSEFGEIFTVPAYCPTEPDKASKRSQEGMEQILEGVDHILL